MSNTDIHELTYDHLHGLCRCRTTDALTAAINSLPQHLRDYIHDLESRADPAGDLRARRMAEDAAEAYRREIDRLLAIAFVSDPVIGSVSVADAKHSDAPRRSAAQE